MEPSYIRKSSQRKYLDRSLNMHELYIEINPSSEVTLSTYPFVFNTQYNYSFYQPKKDQCIICCSLDRKKKENTITEEELAKLDEHIKQKDRAQQKKGDDKQKAEQYPSTISACFWSAKRAIYAMSWGKLPFLQQEVLDV